MITIPYLCLESTRSLPKADVDCMAWAAHGDCDQADHDTGSRGLQTVHGAPCEPNSNRHIAVPWCRQHTRPRHAHPCPARARPRSTRKPGPQTLLEPTVRSVRLLAAYDSTSGSASYAGQLGRTHGLLRDPSPPEAVEPVMVAGVGKCARPSTNALRCG